METETRFRVILTLYFGFFNGIMECSAPAPPVTTGLIIGVIPRTTIEENVLHDFEWENELENSSIIEKMTTHPQTSQFKTEILNNLGDLWSFSKNQLVSRESGESELLFDARKTRNTLYDTDQISGIGEVEMAQHSLSTFQPRFTSFRTTPLMTNSSNYLFPITSHQRLDKNPETRRAGHGVSTLCLSKYKKELLNKQKLKEKLKNALKLYGHQKTTTTTPVPVPSKYQSNHNDFTGQSIETDNELEKTLTSFAHGVIYATKMALVFVLSVSVLSIALGIYSLGPPIIAVGALGVIIPIVLLVLLQLADEKHRIEWKEVMGGIESKPVDESDNVLDLVWDAIQKYGT